MPTFPDDPMLIPVLPEDSAWLQALKPGDSVHRNLGGSLMRLKVSEVTRDRVICGAWEFDRRTGAEIDEELGWGPQGTGSWIRPLSH
jgi:hypothetical protein